MKTSIVAVCSLVALLSLAAGAGAADRVQAGEWETSLTVGSAKPMISKYCITAAEAKIMNGNVAELRKYLEENTAEKTGGRCAVRNVEVHDNQVVVTQVCGKTKIVTATMYHGDHFESRTSEGAVQTGKRLGDCP